MAALELATLRSLGAEVAVHLGSHRAAVHVETGLAVAALELAALRSLRAEVAVHFGSHRAAVHVETGLVVAALELAALRSLRAKVAVHLGSHRAALFFSESVAVFLEEIHLSGVSFLGADLAVLISIVASHEFSLLVNLNSLRSRGSLRSRSGLLSKSRHHCSEENEDVFLHNVMFV